MIKDLRRSDRASARVRPGAGGEAGIELRIAGRDQGRTILEISLREGRTGNLGKMLAAAGVHVRKLERTAIGPIELTNLARGRWRELERDEIRLLRRAGKGDPASPQASAKPGPRRRRRPGGQRSRQDVP